MTTPLHILGSCTIANGQVLLNQRLVLEAPGQPFAALAEQAYQQLAPDYPKFYKMNSLAKLGFLAAEYLLSTFAEGARPALAGPDTGIMLANRSASLDTDLKHATLLRQGIASPAVFVYTLPNIVIGELCIRHGITGENTFFVAADYDIAGQVAYVQQLADLGLLRHCLAGWVELTPSSYHAFLYLVGPATTPAGPAFTPTTVHQLFRLPHEFAEV